MVRDNELDIVFFYQILLLDSRLSNILTVEVSLIGPQKKHQETLVAIKFKQLPAISFFVILNPAAMSKSVTSSAW